MTFVRRGLAGRLTLTLLGMTPIIRQREPFLTLGPPPTQPPLPVTERTVTDNARVILNTPEGYHYDLRAIGNPYWVDDEAAAKWLPGSDLPDGADQDRAMLRVCICPEADWYRWNDGGRMAENDPRRTGAASERLASVVWLQ